MYKEQFEVLYVNSDEWQLSHKQLKKIKNSPIYSIETER